MRCIVKQMYPTFKIFLFPETKDSERVPGEAHEDELQLEEMEKRGMLHNVSTIRNNGTIIEAANLLSPRASVGMEA